MRLHTLSIDAFGPFVAPQRVDFDVLGTAGLFLVHGATGAGKTSVLDAVCYALFSDIPGARASRGLRADLAPPERATSVTLEFSSAGRRFRITRSPEHVRPKVRGTGATKTPARVVLSERVNGSWLARSTRIEETADLVRDVVGMALAQFQRVALLPQGQFADFLRAEPRERHQLLTALFDVTTFEDVETWLAERRRSQADRVGQLSRDLDYQVRTLADLCSSLPGALDGAAGPVVPDADAGVGGSDLATTAAEHWDQVGPTLLARLESAATQALGEAEMAASGERACQQAHDDAVRIARLLRRGADAGTALRALDGRAEEITNSRERLRWAALASELRGELADLVTAETADARARAAADQAADALAQASGRRVPVDELQHLAMTVATSADSLNHARAAVAELHAAAVSQRAAQTEVVNAQKQVERSAAELATATRRHTARADTHRRLRALAADLPPAQAAHDRVAALSARVRELIIQVQALADVAPRILNAREVLLAARETLVQQQLRRLEDLAGELAAGLHPDTPCPVCGSPEHPLPAPAASGWSPAALADAEAAVATASDRLIDLDRERHTTEAVRDRLLAEVTPEVALSRGGVDPLGLRHRPPTNLALADWQSYSRALELDAAALRERVETAASAHAALPGIEEEAAIEQAEAERLGCAATTAESGLAVAHGVAAAADQRLTLAKAHLREAIVAHTHACPCAGPNGKDDPPADGSDQEALARGVGELSAAHDHLDAVLALSRAADAESLAAAATLAAARTALAQALATSGFTDRAALESALLGAAQVAALHEQVAAHDQLVAIHRATLADPEIVMVRAIAHPPDPAVTEAALSEAREVAHRTDRLRHDTDRIARAARTAITRVVDSASALTAARTELAQLAALADLTGGTSSENTLRMRLSTFVLASRLERVVDLANERLLLMGEGRFQLEHDDSLAGRGARSGLGLRVRDNWSGTTRSPASLSGGESFIASLALALGLSDTLRESVGGIELQTLFIDEGFGALDESSLEDVLGVLDGLRDGGRAVGVVSHVPELRDRIPAQLWVTKSPTGSTLAVTTELAQPA